MKELTIQEIQNESIRVLSELDRICQEKGFKYWVTAGTLLGAIRHKGFIPWDDDVDVGMPRNDYDRFANYINSNEYDNSNFSIHSIKTVENYPFYINRLCEMKNELHFDNFSYISGCFVDIYPYDGMGDADNYKYWKSLEPKLQKYQKKITMAAYDSWMYGDSILHKILNTPLLIVAKLNGTEYYFNKMEKIRSQWTWEESNFVGVPCWSCGTYMYPKEWFQETVRIPFEQIYVNAPREYDSFLRQLYGDYMQLPPVEKRKPYHGYQAFRR